MATPPESLASSNADAAVADRNTLALTPGATAANDWYVERRSIGLIAAQFWLNLLFWCSRHLPWVVRSTVPFWVWATWLSSPALRDRTQANARWLLGEQSTPKQRRQLGWRVIRSFYLFVFDVGRHAGLDCAAIARDIRDVQGKEHYDAARAGSNNGLIVATAHMGSFEVGIASLRAQETDINVVFHRDRMGLFEKLRTDLRKGLGICEVAVGDGAASWTTLGEALQRNEVVLMQGDRAMPGQKAVAVPFMGGHIEMPVGVAKLAALAQCPIVPVLTHRHDDGTVSITIEPAIAPQSPEAFYAQRNSVPDSITALGAVIEKHVARSPEQWLMLRRAFVEDASN